MEFTAKCTISKNNKNVKELMQKGVFNEGKLTNYGDIIKKLQAEVNQALTDIVNQENSLCTETEVSSKRLDGQGDIGTDDDDDGEADEDEIESSKSPKHKLLSKSWEPDEVVSPTKKIKEV